MIDTQHIESALALCEYANASAAFLFSDRAADPLERKIVAILKTSTITATGLNKALSKHVPRDKLQTALGSLEAAGRIRVEKQASGGRPTSYISLREVSIHGQNP
ncbi:MAG: hypothetical protein LBJ46_05680 [Planctomycetota bacterium]|nr:hypothetical protein [Planctomycetota bacterium]